MCFLKQKHVHQLLYWRHFLRAVSWEGPLPKIQRAQEKGETVLDQALLGWMAQAVE